MPKGVGGGRPTKINDKMLTTMKRAIQVGNFPTVAATFAGISQASYYNYMKRGQEDLEQGKTNRYTKFLEVVLESEAQMETGTIALIRKEFEGNPTLMLEFLSRRFPGRWGKQRVEVTGAEGGPVRFGLEQETKDEVRGRILKAMAQRPSE